MGSYQEKLTVKLDPDLMIGVYRLAESQGYKTVSELVRTSLRQFIDEETRKSSPNTLIITLPPTLNYLLDLIIESGIATKKEQVIEEALRSYLPEMVDKYSSTKKNLESLAYKIRSNLDIEDEGKDNNHDNGD